MSVRRSRYGRAVLGEAEFERQKNQYAKSKGIYGPAVTGEPKDEVKPATPPVDSGDANATDAQLSVKDLAKLLKESPELLDRQIEAEFMRDDGPRRTAVRLFIEHEKKREAPRATVIAYLERSLDDTR